MIENGYVAILQHDSMRMRHPANPNQIITLYRIIATKTFILPEFDKTVQKHEIGGWIESIENLDTNTPVWIDNNARVFDKAKVINGSLIKNMALIYDDCVIDNSIVLDHCRVHGSSIVKDSKIKNQCEIKDKAQIINSNIRKSCKLYGNCIIQDSTFNIAAFAHGDAQVYNSDISDISEIRGTAIVRNCRYSGRVIKESGEYVNETIDAEVKLNIHEEVDESTHSEYNIKI